MEISRRELLKLLGVSGGATVVGLLGANTLLSVPDEVFERVLSGPRLETWKNSICSHCPGGCGVRIRLIDDIPVRVAGNPLYPVNRGAVCPMAEAGVEELFHPRRILKPLLRVGKKSRHEWKEISREEAEGILAERLGSLRSAGTPERLALLSRDENTLTTRFLGQFMRAFGSPNYFCVGDNQISALPVELTQGVATPPVYDLANTSYVLNFGADLLDEPPSPVRMNQIYASLRSRENKSRASVIHISSHMSRTASNSSQWVPINPGTGAALALSIAYVMVTDRSYDLHFVENRCNGFSKWKDSHGQWHDGFESLIDSYYPERVAGLTGVPADTIVEIARNFAAAKPALAIPGPQVSHATNGLYSLWAIYCLNALKGNLGQTGGVLFPAGRSPAPDKLELDPVARTGLQQPKMGSDPKQLSIRVDSLHQVITGLQQKEPHRVDTLLVHRANAVRESTNQDQCRAALQKVPFLVCSTTFMNETAQEADLVLPEPVFLERWDISLDNPGFEFAHLGVQQPAIESAPDTRQLENVLLRVAEQLPGGVSGALPWKSYEDYLMSHAGEVFESGAGTIVSESVELSWLEFLKERGWRALDYSDFDEFWALLLEKGGWWNPVDPRSAGGTVFHTGSGKFEFYAHSLQEELEKRLSGAASLDDLRQDLTQSWKIEASGDSILLPHFEAPRFFKDDVEFPLHLFVCPQITNIGGQGSHLSLLQELHGLHSRHYWNSWVEINPETAARFGVEQDDHVHIISPKGHLTAVARVVPTVMPEVVVMPPGPGEMIVGRFGKRPGANPFSLFVEETDLLSGVESLISTRVRVEKALRGALV